MLMRSDKRELDKVYKRRDRYEIPDWQRDKVWDLPRKQALIDSILRGWRLPKFYFLVTSKSPQTYDVVGGQQRLATIFEFIGNELELSEETAQRFGGKYYKSLPEDISDKIDDFEIDFDEIEEATDDEITEFFQRLQSGLQLNSSEKLNAIPGKLRAFCRKMAKHNFFKKKVAFADKRYAHFDVMAKVATLEIEGISASLRYEDVKTVFEDNQSFSEQSLVAKRIKAALDFLDKAIPAGSTIFRSRAVTQSFLNLICLLQKSDVLDGHEKDIAEFASEFVSGLSAEVEKGQSASDGEFIKFQRSINANVKSGPEIRNKILVKKLIQSKPNLLEDAFSDLAVSVDLVGDIKSISQDVAEKIININKTYSSKSGEDFFKMTSKTAQALTKIGAFANSYDNYKKFVEQLYFLFWEGPGSKMPEKPQSFKDINVLRTDLQHDTDHGDKNKVRNKKKKHGEVFEKYSGVSSISLASPPSFSLLQLNILIALRNDLEFLPPDAP